MWSDIINLWSTLTDIISNNKITFYNRTVVQCISNAERKWYMYSKCDGDSESLLDPSSTTRREEEQLYTAKSVYYTTLFIIAHDSHVH